MPTLKARIGGAWVPIAGAGSGANEVEINPNDPIATNPGCELWYDSDDPGGSGVMYPLGIVKQVATSGSVNCPINTVTYLHAAMVFTFIAGRQYRIGWCFRATGRADNADTPYRTSLTIYDGTTALTAWVDSWHEFRGQYTDWQGSVLVTDASARSLRFGVGTAGTVPTTALSIFPTQVWIEDLGLVVP